MIAAIRRATALRALLPGHGSPRPHRRPPPVVRRRPPAQLRRLIDAAGCLVVDLRRPRRHRGRLRGPGSGDGRAAHRPGDRRERLGLGPRSRRGGERPRRGRRAGAELALALLGGRQRCARRALLPRRAQPGDPRRDARARRRGHRPARGRRRALRRGCPGHDGSATDEGRQRRHADRDGGMGLRDQVGRLPLAGGDRRRDGQGLQLQRHRRDGQAVRAGRPLARLHGRQAVLDGELVALDARAGRASSCWAATRPSPTCCSTCSSWTARTSRGCPSATAAASSTRRWSQDRTGWWAPGRRATAPRCWRRAACATSRASWPSASTAPTSRAGDRRPGGRSRTGTARRW